MIGSCLFLNGDIEKINGGADIFDSITEKKLVMSRCLLSKRTEKDETFFTGNTHQEGMTRVNSEKRAHSRICRETPCYWTKNTIMRSVSRLEICLT